MQLGLTGQRTDTVVVRLVVRVVRVVHRALAIVLHESSKGPCCRLVLVSASLGARVHLVQIAIVRKGLRGDIIIEVSSHFSDTHAHSSGGVDLGSNARLAKEPSIEGVLRCSHRRVVDEANDTVLRLGKSWLASHVSVCSIFGCQGPADQSLCTVKSLFALVSLAQQRKALCQERES